MCSLQICVYMFKIIGDLHLTLNENVNQKILNSVDKETGDLTKNDSIIFLGDVFDTFDIGLKTTSFYSFLNEKARKVKNIYVLTGNHDIKRGAVSFKMVGQFLKNVIIVDHTYSFEDDKVNYIFVNFFRYAVSNLPKLNPDKKNIIFTHAEINNLNEIPKEFSDANLIINGHIHDGSQFGNLVNVGAFRQVASNESYIKNIANLDDNGKITLTDVKSPIKVVVCSSEDISNYSHNDCLKFIIKDDGVRDISEIKELFSDKDLWFRSRPWRLKNYAMK